MKSESLLHDIARSTAISIVKVFENLLREEEIHDAFVEVYARVKEGLDLFETKQQRLMQRMKPTRK